jgi:rod shape-determining protein MreD
MRYLYLAVSSFLAVVVQMIASENFFLFSFLDISLILVAWCAIYRSRVQALLFGSFTGLLLDGALGWPFGYNGFGRTLAVFIIGQLWDRFNTAEQPAVRFLILAASSLASSLSMYLLFWIMQRTTSRVFPGSAILQALITAGVGLVFFIFLERYKRAQALKAH